MADESDFSFDDQVLDEGRLQDYLSGDLPMFGENDANIEPDVRPPTAHVDLDSGSSTADGSAGTSESHEDIASIFQTGAKSAADIAKAAADAQIAAAKNGQRPPATAPQPRSPSRPAAPAPVVPAPANPAPISVANHSAMSSSATIPLVIGGVLAGGLLLGIIAAASASKRPRNRYQVRV